MAKIASSTSALAGVNAPAHPPIDRRAPAAVPVGDTPTRRASRRRFFMEAGATIVTALGVTAAVLVPDPSWGNPQEPRAGARLPDPDAHLVTLCADYIEAVRSYNEDGGTAEPEDDPAWAALNALEDRIEDTPAHTLAGVAAKSRVAAFLARNLDGTHHFGDSYTGRWPEMVVRDVLRLVGVEVPA